MIRNMLLYSLPVTGLRAMHAGRPRVERCTWSPLPPFYQGLAERPMNVQGESNQGPAKA